MPRKRTAAADPVPAPSGDEMAALAALGANGPWELQGRTLKLTNLDKVLFPAGVDRSGIEQPAFTKRDLIAHYATVGPQMVPYLRGRGLNMHRFPNGVDKPGFWHKEAPDHAPDWIPTWTYDHVAEGTTREYFVVDSVPALAWMANFGVIEMHAWTSPCSAPDEPSYALIDLDPGQKTTFDDLVTLALLHRTALDHLGVAAQPKVTGQRGIQIWVPVEPGLQFSDTREWVEKVSRAVGAMVPDLVSWAWETRARKGLARLDYTQNAHNKTLVAPYSVRAAIGAPVSMPITWDEVDDPDLRPDRWNIATAPERIAEVGDLFAPVLTERQVLPDL